MKKATIYLLLFAYTTIVCKPIFPSLADSIAHVFWYSEHMATVHVENGKYHVHLAYAKAAKKGYPEKDANIPKQDTDTQHLNNTDIYQFLVPARIQTHCFIANGYLPIIHLHSDFPPPRA